MAETCLLLASPIPHQVEAPDKYLRSKTPSAGKEQETSWTNALGPHEAAGDMNPWRTPPVGSIVTPATGQTYVTSEAAYEVYNIFSWHRGFGVRYGKSRSNMNGFRRRLDIVCSCAGLGGSGVRTTHRTGCKAMIRLLRTEGDLWFISRFIDEHNHPLFVGCGQTRQWRSHNHLDPSIKKFVRNVRSNNISLGRMYGLLETTLGQPGYAPFTKTTLRSLCDSITRDSITDDIGKTMRLLQSMQRDDPNFSLAVDTDEFNRITCMIWCNGRNKIDYVDFGDVVTFDTTYRTNMYNMPFGLFVGVNSHFQSTIFAGLLMTNETTAIFEWAFKNFLSFMGGKELVTVLTDQCAAMEAALRTVMPRTRHRWCRWHVLKNAKDNLGSVYSKTSGFKKEFHELVSSIMTPDSFENRWAALLGRYGLEGNTYLGRMFASREMWAKPYFRDTFCAGMTSTQRSESANHLLKTFIPRSAPMHLFVSQYHAMLRAREADEDREEHVTKQKKRLIRIGAPVEWHAAKIYTRVMFGKFSGELYAAGGFAASRLQDGTKYSVNAVIQAVGQVGGPEIHEVSRGPGGSYYGCSYCMYEHIGMYEHNLLANIIKLGNDIVNKFV